MIRIITPCILELLFWRVNKYIEATNPIIMPMMGNSNAPKIVPI